VLGGAALPAGAGAAFCSVPEGVAPAVAVPPGAGAVAGRGVGGVVERGNTGGRRVVGRAQGDRERRQRGGGDTLVLGWTHYPMLSGVIQIAMGPDVTLVSSAEETAKDVVRVLSERDLLREPAGPPPAHTFLATGPVEPFRRLGRRFLGPEIGAVTSLSLATPAAEAGRDLRRRLG